VSIGVASSTDHGYELDRLLARADLAMYRAKSEGRDRVVGGR
jgi:diguanylate cyclase (GGDEF)-like protein